MIGEPSHRVICNLNNLIHKFTAGDAKEGRKERFARQRESKEVPSKGRLPGKERLTQQYAKSRTYGFIDSETQRDKGGFLA